INDYNQKIETTKKENLKKIFLGIILLCCSINIPGLSPAGISRVGMGIEATSETSSNNRFNNVLEFLKKQKDKYHLTDESLAFIEKLPTLYPHIKYVENPRNKRLDVQVDDDQLDAFINNTIE